MFSGSKDQFKVALDLYLETIPDEPETEDRKPGGRTEFGECSNSIPDWLRKLPGLKTFPLKAE